MAVSSEKSKVMVNNTDSKTCVNITMDGNSLEEVSTFKYLGAILSEDGTRSSEIHTRRWPNWQEYEAAEGTAFKRSTDFMNR